MEKLWCRIKSGTAANSLGAGNKPLEIPDETDGRGQMGAPPGGPLEGNVERQPQAPRRRLERPRTRDAAALESERRVSQLDESAVASRDQRKEASDDKWLDRAKSVDEPAAATSDFNIDQQRSQSGGSLYDCLAPLTRSRLHTLAQIGEDWLYLALLGIIMALLSIGMDSMISALLETRIWLSLEASGQNLLVEYLAWCLMPILLVSFSTGFVHLCSPTAIGSGIPEMKTILRGVVLNEYLTFRTLIAKIVGLTFTLGSGLPLGKEGPSVHMASIVATLLSKLVASFQGIYENESRTSEMLSAACAVGVAATFYAPIGGVLFSIEVTTVYFAVRNYWRGFFAACCGATVWRLLGFYIQNDESISAIFKTNFNTDYPFDPVELLLFSLIGATCGLGAAAYIKFHREIVQFFRRHKRISGFFQRNRFVYPILVTLIITTSTFPPLFGKYTAATLSTHTTIEHLFSNRTWSAGGQDLASKQILDTWTTESTGFHLHLVLYILMLFWTSALASTIPTPSGVFIPVVKMGAAYGRLVGELMAAAYPEGIKYTHSAMIVPGSYAVVGAAAFSGAVTHTVSTSVILFEMTGQIVHIIPVILGVLISNAVCQSLQPSIYDSIIEIKKLPYLPPIASSNSISHRILVKDFMNKKNIPFVWKDRCTYADLKTLLSTHRKIISFPLVESPLTMKLLGSVARPDLLKLLYMHLGRERRLQEVCRRNSDTLTPAIHLLNTISGRHLTGTINEHTTLHADHGVNGQSNTSANQTDGPNKKTSIDSSASSSEDRGIEFISAEDLQQKHGQQQQHLGGPTQPMGHVTMLPAPNLTPKLSVPLSHILSRPQSNRLQMDHDDDDNDPTRLIISPNKNCHKYGATSFESESQRPHSRSGSLDGIITDKYTKTIKRSISSSADRETARPKFGEEKLLNECQKRDCASDSMEKEFAGVAKSINHYDRGSTMDKDNLERSIQEVEGHMAMAKHMNPEIVVVIDALPPSEDQSERKVGLNQQADGEHMSSQLSLHLLRAPEEPINKLQPRATARRKVKPTIIGTATTTTAATITTGTSAATAAAYQIGEKSTPRPISILKLSPSASPVLNHHYRKHQPLSHSVSSSPSLSSRPFKSILKTSSCHNMSKKPKSVMHSPSINRNISIVSKRLDKQAESFEPERSNQDRNEIQLNDQDSTNNNRPIDTNAANISNLRFANAPDLLSYKSQTVDLDLESGDMRPQQMRQRRKVRLPRLRVVDMTPEEQEQWEKEQLSAFIELDKCQIDEAPFQLVEQTSLYRVHTLFSMLGLNHAYVTSFGRLVGIVALKDIRNAIEKMLQSKV